ncbi:MAG: CsgG/HfaB family protein, partial [Acidobacteriota bacterium]
MMKRWNWERTLPALAILLSVLYAFASPMAGQDTRIRIAVVDFDTQAIRQNWHYSWSYQNLERAAADNLAAQLVKTGRFRVIERQQLDQVLAEQNLGDSFRLDARTAARIGKILGVQVVVIGSVIEFGINEKRARIPQIGKWKFGRGVAGRVVTGKSSLTARLVDTTTAEILGAYDATGSHRFGSGEFAGAHLGTTWDSGMASKVLGEAVEKLARQMAGGAAALAPAVHRQELEGKVAKANGSSIYLNIGSAAGVKPDDRFEIRGIGQ